MELGLNTNTDRDICTYPAEVAGLDGRFEAGEDVDVVLPTTRGTAALRLALVLVQHFQVPRQELLSVEVR